MWELNLNINKFWETKTLVDMNKNEWESLCDKCGKCCVIKLEDYDNITRDDIVEFYKIRLHAQIIITENL